MDPLFVEGCGVRARTDESSCKVVAHLSEGELVGESRLLVEEEDVLRHKLPLRNSSIVAHGDIAVLTLTCAEARMRISPDAMAAVRKVAQAKVEATRAKVGHLYMAEAASDVFGRMRQEAAHQVRSHCCQHQAWNSA